MAEVKDIQGQFFGGLYEGWEVEFSSGVVLFASRMTDNFDLRYLVSVSDGLDTTEIGYIKTRQDFEALAAAIEKIIEK